MFRFGTVKEVGEEDELHRRQYWRFGSSDYGMGSRGVFIKNYYTLNQHSPQECNGTIWQWYLCNGTIMTLLQNRDL